MRPARARGRRRNSPRSRFEGRRSALKRFVKLSTLPLAALLVVCAAHAAETGADARVVAHTTAVQSSAVYKLDPARSKFVVRAFAGGVLWFKGHDHFVAARDFDGEARLTPGSVNPASLTLTVRAASLAETRDVFTEQQKKIIDGELRDIVLEPDRKSVV